jgi:hypothetical protein
MTRSAEPPSEQQGRVPEFFIVGHPKCGTTALYEMLRCHSAIFMPDFKEPWFFAEDLRPRFRRTHAGHGVDSLADYTRLFAPAGERLAGEASSCYLFSHLAAERIAQARPDARAIAIFREPASFLRSLHEQMLRDHIESERDLGRALALEEERRAGRHIPARSHLPQMLMYSDYIRYAEQLRRFRDALGADRVLVLIHEEFRADNAAALRSVQRFLGVQERPLEAVEANSSDRSMRSQRLDEMLNDVAVGTGPLARSLKRAMKTALPASARRGALRLARRKLVYAPPRPADERVMAELRERYRPEVEALGECLGRDLGEIWSPTAAQAAAQGASS